MERQNRKRKQFNTVEMKVRMDCDGCELRVRNILATMRGVQSVDINRKQQKVTVQGFVETQRVLRRIQSTTRKRAELWPYVPYTNPYAAPPVYDKKAPAGHVRRVEAAVVSVPGAGPGQEERLVTLFSDDNPNACTLM
ncbi:hypothetical protein EJB05_49345, partial [Eragrostis curvula]